MFNMRQHFYHLVLFSAALLVAVGCGQSPPPPGAPQSISPASIELGSESGLKDPAAGSTDSTPGNGSPRSEQGETK